MHHLSRRCFLARISYWTAASLVFPWTAAAESDCRIAHPLDPPNPIFQGRCPNCGMGRAMWARTWKTFHLAGRRQEACSFHCLADMTVKSGADPEAVQTALFTEPRGMIAARDAWYVVGSSAAGTMTMVSKAAFVTRSEALAFAKRCGGDVMEFSATFQAARDALARENAAIDRKRLNRGTIVPPQDMQDECVVCRMYPARYPLHRCQVTSAGRPVDHFCSTHCLFVWLGQPSGGGRRDVNATMIWVTDFAAGRWISGRTATYVVDSKYAGPMGAEAVAFDRRAGAQAFVRKWGGRLRTFEQVETGSAVWSPSAS